MHVGMVLPGFVATEGFPQAELREPALTRWMVSKPETVAGGDRDAGPAAPRNATSRGPTGSRRRCA